jgi:hypothetical protein
MYVQDRLSKDRQQERLRQAEQQRSARQLTELRRLEKRSERAERQLLSAWQRVERMRSTLEAAG